MESFCSGPNSSENLELKNLSKKNIESFVSLSNVSRPRCFWSNLSGWWHMATQYITVVVQNHPLIHIWKKTKNTKYKRERSVHTRKSQKVCKNQKIKHTQDSLLHSHSTLLPRNRLCSSKAKGRKASVSTPQLLLRDGEIKIYQKSLVQVRGPNPHQNAYLLKDSQSISAVQDAVIKYWAWKLEILAWRKTINHIKPIQNWAKDLNRHAFKGEPQMSTEYMRRCSISPIIRDMHANQSPEISHTNSSEEREISICPKSWRNCSNYAKRKQHDHQGDQTGNFWSS